MSLDFLHIICCSNMQKRRRDMRRRKRKNVSLIVLTAFIQKSSEGLDTNENSYFPFIENFLSTLYMCYKELDKRFAVVHGKKITKKARIEATVLNRLTSLSKAEICKILPDVSPTTVESVFGTMVKSRSVKRIGSSRSSCYIKA